MINDSNIAALMQAVETGSRSASEALFAALYSELHGLAKREVGRAGGSVTISATTLLHQAYLEISAREGVCFPDQAKFMGYAARVMRGLMIDHARSRNAQKRGGEFEITSLGPETDQFADDRELTRISEALDELAKTDGSLAEIVDLRFFCGFGFAEIAAMKGVSERTAQRQWEKARLYLHHAMRAEA